MNAANLISISHLVLLPFIVYFILLEIPFFTALAIVFLLFSVAADVTEKVAGKQKAVTSFLHPFSDKIVVLTLLFVFAVQGIFSGLVFAVFLARDIVIGIMRMAAARDDVVIRGELYGKTITALQFVLVFMLLSKRLFPPLTNSLIMVISFFTSVILVLGTVSILHYGYVYAKGLRTRRELGKVVGQEHMVVLANKKSGGYSDRYRRYLLKIFAKRRKAPIHYLSEKNLFRGVDAKLQKKKNVIIAGGDGTFEAALNYKPLQEKSLGFFPLGAGNSFYSYFYKGKRFEYLRSRFPFREVLLDVLELEWEGGTRDTLFLSIGVDAEVAHEIKHKQRHSFADYVAAGAKVAFGKPIRYDLECSVDGRKYHWNNGINLIVGKVPYIGYGIRSLLGTSKEDDGSILGMACVNAHAPFFNKALRLWGMFLTQLGLVKAPLISLKGEEFAVRSKKEFPLQAGGEFLGYTKWMRVKVKRKQKVLMI